jgi:microcystin degradation protein MlrC
MSRIALAQFLQETDTFNPEPTTWSAFESYRLQLEPTRTPAVDPGSELEGSLEVLVDHDVMVLFQAWGGVGGRVEERLHREVGARLRDGLSGGRFDACLLMLHGACAAEGEDDPEGVLVEVAREVLGPAIPIAVALDHHANITSRLVDAATLVVGHQTEPHRPNETAAIVARLLLEVLEDQLDPVTALVKVPMVAPQEHFETNTGPMAEIFSMARSLERGPVRAVSPFPMQPWLDVDEGGWGVTAVADGDEIAAKQAASAIAEAMWARRERFWELTSLPVEDAVQRAVECDGLGVIVDLGDVVWGGGAGDGVATLPELLARSGQHGVTVRDQAATSAAWAAGVGATIEVSLGGSVDKHFTRPIPLRATVASLSEGPIEVPGLFGLRTIDEGQAALLTVGSTHVHVTEKPGAGGCHPACFERHGLRIADLDVVVVKSSANYHPYRPWMGQLHRANTPGLTQSDLTAFPWQRIPRPTFGLDGDAQWHRG